MAKTKEQLFDSAIKEWREMADRYSKRAAERMNKIGRLEVWRWYKSYSPFYYKRKRTLYYGFKVTGGNGVVTTIFSSKDMYKIHFVDQIDPNYIFHNSFIEGYHGGARDGIGHPMPGVPYYRTPYPDFTDWSRPAVRTESPFERINKAFDEYVDETKERMFKEFKRKIAPKVEKAMFG